MTADPVKDALRAAARDMNGRMADRGYEVPWPEDAATIAAAAVAAFLRALPTDARATLLDEHAGQITSRPGIGQTGAWWAGHLAAAVEKAARDG